MKKLLLLFYLLLTPILFYSQITIDFCPVSKNQALPKGFSSTISITNNTGVVLDLANNKFSMEWPSLVSLPWPFSDGVQNGINWDFKINLNWPGTLVNGSTANVEVKNALFSGVLQFPSSGSYKQNGKTYTVKVNHCNKTDNFELFDKKFNFDRDCFIKSPTSNMCLGEAATEVWQGEGIFDAAVPKDRPSWAIAIMVAHRLFTNLTKLDMVSPNFFTATALNESRMTCDPTIVPDIKNHWAINSQANLGTGIDNRTDNCFQVLNIGYVQLENNQPDLFAQTNSFGSASFNSVISGGKWETGALAVTYYHYQNIQYWNQIKCLNLLQVSKDSKDPYATEKVLYHAFHDGFNDGTSLIEDIRSNYTNAINASNMNTVIGTGGTWSNLGGGSSQKVANLTSLLDGKGSYPYPTQASDKTTKYYGCYEESIKWSDILFYLDKIKILYPQVMGVNVQSKIKKVFDSLNNGGDVLFSNLGPVIDEIVIQMGGHDPSSYLATQYSANKDCPKNPIGVSLRTNDTLCPGEVGNLQVWLSGDPKFKVDIKFPDNSVRKFTDITSSPYNIEINQPGLYEVVYFEDLDEVGDINCNFAKINVESKNGSIVNWDKTNWDDDKKCVNGDLIIKKIGEQDLTITYTKDGITQPKINISKNEDSKIILKNVNSGTFIITEISPNKCGTKINDTITFCSECTKPSYKILTKDTTICKGDTGLVRLSLNGKSPYRINYSLNNIDQTSIISNSNNISIPIWNSGVVEIKSIVDLNCINDTLKSVKITVNELPVVNLGNDTTICDSSKITLDPGDWDTYLWNNGSKSGKIDVSSDGEYWVKVDKDGCSGVDTINLFFKRCDEKLCGGDINFNTWKQYGVKDDGDWTVSPDGSNVRQNLNKGVTFFNGEKEYLNISFSGKIKVDANPDDDWIGMVFGFRSDNLQISYPIDIKTYVLTWKKRDQVSFGKEGFSLLSIDNIFNNRIQMKNAFTEESNPNNNGTTVLSTKFDKGLGYEHDKEHDIKVDYTSSNIKAYIDGVKIFDVDGCFEPGKIGFYNLSQDNVTYSNFTYKFIANIDLDKDTICLGEEISLTTKDCDNKNIYPIGTKFKWDLKDGTLSEQSSLKHTYRDTGVYNVRLIISDGLGCNDTTYKNIFVMGYPKSNLGNDTTICGESTFKIKAGDGKLKYNWSTNETTNEIRVNKTGEYWVEIFNEFNCNIKDTILVNFKENPVVDLGNDTTICKGDSIILDAKNIGSNYKWNTNETTQKITINESGVYKVQIIDSNNCIGLDSMKLIVSIPPVVDLGNDTTICEKESIILDVKNIGSNYKWNTNESTQKITVTESGLYSVEVKDNIGCLGSDEIKITVKELPIVNLSNDTTICKGSNLVLDAKNVGSNYKWNTNESTQKITVDKSGLYSVEVRDNIGCLGSDEIKITVKELPIVSLGNDTTICKGNNIIIDAKNVGSNYKWNTNESTQKITVTESGLYSVEVRDNIGCLKTDQIKITVKELPVVNLGNDTTICKSSNLVLDTKNIGLNYKWSTNESTQKIIVDKSGLYSVEVRDNIGCLKTDEIKITVKDLPVVNLGNDTTICKGDNITIDAKNIGSNYKWSTNETTQKITVDKSGLYSVEVRDNIGCLGVDEIKITVKELPVVNLGNDTTICLNKTIDLSVGLFDSYIWSTNETTNIINVNKSGNYWVKVKDNIGCIGFDEIKITIKELPIINLGNDTTICLGSELLLKANNNFRYLWNNGKTDQSILVNSSGEYSVTVYDNIGCESTDNIIVRLDSIQDPFIKKEKFLCLNNSLTLKPDKFNNYDITWGGFKDSLIVSSPGTYISTVSNGKCSKNFEIKVIPVDTPDVFIFNKKGGNVFCFDYEKAELEIRGNNVSNIISTWYPMGERGNSISLDSAGIYVVYSKDDNCTSINKITLVNHCDKRSFIPTSFTPNGDGLNDEFKPKLENIIDYKLMIFNRWGQLIFESNDIEKGWNGTYMGSNCQIDVYVYKISYKYYNNFNRLKDEYLIGNITLYR